MDETQKYWFDSQGYFVVPNILNASEIEALKATMGPATEQHTPGQKEDNPLHWSAEWRALLDLPTPSPRAGGLGWEPWFPSVSHA